jgi:hypothetical protein
MLQRYPLGVGVDDFLDVVAGVPIIISLLTGFLIYLQYESNSTLWMKFKIDISKRTVPYVMRVLEEYIPIMPFRPAPISAQQTLIEQLDKQLC